MDKRFLYSFIAFFVFSGIPIGVIMLSIAVYPSSTLTTYAVDNFGSIIVSLFLVTIAVIGGVFYVYMDSRSREASRGSD